jgi:putative membrane protein
VRALTALALLGASGQASAHAQWALSAPDGFLALLLAAALLLYAGGTVRLWTAAPGHRRALPARAVPFALGWLLLALALLPPLAPISAGTFSGHMLQHEVLMVAAAPLLVLGRPLAIWVWSFPAGWRRSVASPARSTRLRAMWSFVTAPLTATILHGAAIWIWHAPPLFAAAEANVWVHALQHSAFFFTALLFWNAVCGPREGTVRAGALFWLFVTMLHTGALGVLLTFSAGLWYREAPEAAAWGLTALEDQQLGGLIMWVPGGTVYVIAALALGARWLESLEARAARS